MNKELFAKVKDKCKDTGLSEKYLTAITEAMGGSVADDSTDNDAIESTANLILSVATARLQGGRTRQRAIRNQSQMTVRAVRVKSPTQTTRMAMVAVKAVQKKARLSRNCKKRLQH